MVKPLDSAAANGPLAPNHDLTKQPPKCNANRKRSFRALRRSQSAPRPKRPELKWDLVTLSGQAISRSVIGGQRSTAKNLRGPGTCGPHSGELQRPRKVRSSSGTHGTHRDTKQSCRLPWNPLAISLGISGLCILGITVNPQDRGSLRESEEESQRRGSRSQGSQSESKVFSQHKAVGRVPVKRVPGSSQGRVIQSVEVELVLVVELRSG